MDGHILWQVILQLVLIALNAVFACAEIAVISMNDTKLARLAESGDKRASKLQKLTSEPARFLATIQVAITLSGFLGSAFAADNFAGLIEDAFVKAFDGKPPIPAGTVNTIAVVLITLILSYFTLVFGELVPKRLAQKNSEKLALGMASMISFISKLFAPIVWVLTASTNLILRMFGIDPNAVDEDMTEEEILMMVDAGSDSGAIDEDEKELIQNVFEFDDITAEEACTHRTEIDLLWLEDDLEEWEKTIGDSRHSLYPVCGESVDDIVGILNAKDYFRMNDRTDRDQVMKEAVRPPYFVSQNAHADVIFRKMQSSRNHFAVVLDDYGGTIGILTMNDLLEQLVGDLEDDHNAAIEEDIVHIEENLWKIHGSAPLNDVADEIGLIIGEDADFDTFGGLVFGALAEIPDDGETFDIDIANLSVSVKKIMDHKIVEAIVAVKPPEEEDEDDDDKKNRKAKRSDDDDDD